MGDKKDRKPDNVATGNRVKEILDSLSLTHADLAAIWNMSIGNVEKILNGQQGISITQFVQLWEAIQVEPNEAILGPEYASKYKRHGMSNAEYDIFIKARKSGEDLKAELERMSDEDLEESYDRIILYYLNEKKRRKKK